MAGLARLVFCAITLFLAPSSSALGTEECRWVTGTAFAVCIPERAVFETRDDSGLDFLVHSLSGAGLPEITIYEGNHPEALPRLEGALVGRARIGSVRAQKHSYESAGAKVVFLRVRISRKGWPQYVQLSVVTRTIDEASAVERVLKTFRRSPIAGAPTA